MNNKIKIALLLFMFSKFCMAQVDVVYNDLVWSDEFEVNGAVNPTKWHHQTQLPAGGSWFNGEVQHYTSELTNSFVNAGFLNIVAKKRTLYISGFYKTVYFGTIEFEICF